MKKIEICVCGHTRMAHNNDGSECASCRAECLFTPVEEVETTTFRQLSPSVILSE